MAEARQRRLVAGVLAGGALLVGAAFACSVLSVGSPALRGFAPWVRGPAFVGRVTDMESGQPVAGAHIQAAGHTTRSAPDGSYRLAVPPGEFRIRFEAAGYSGGTVVGQSIQSGELRVDFALPPLAAPAVPPSLPPASEGVATTGWLGHEELPVSGREPVREVPPTIRVLMPSGEIREMDTEEYVKGVVPAEMGFVHRRPVEALKAQAIAARTYAASGCLADSAGDPTRCEPGVDAHVDTTTRTQVWRPIHYDVVDAAVEATRGLAVSYDGALIRALYFARTRARTLASEDSGCCGGRRVEYLRSASSPDPFAERLGHGAGMSQEGAAVFGDWGATAEQILEHYYSPARVIQAAMPTATVSATQTAPPPPTSLPLATPPRPAGSSTVATTRARPSSWAESRADRTAAARHTPLGEDGAPRTALPKSPPTGATVAPATVRGGTFAVAAGDLRIVRGQGVVSASGVHLAAPGILSLEGPPLTADFAFTAVAAAWSATLPEGSELLVLVRTSNDGQQWSDWQELVPDEDDRLTDVQGPVWSRLLIQPGRQLQVAARLRSAALSTAMMPSLSTIAVHYIDGAPGPRAPLVAAATAPIVRRAEWGADERLRFDAQGNEIWPPEYIRPLAQVVHHTVTGNEAVDPAAVVRSIYYYHAVSRGWGDIGYNFLVDHRGRVYEGRYGGEVSGQMVAGGHAREFNAVSIGVALLGTFTSASPNAAMEAGLVELLAAKGLSYGLEPFDPVVLLGRSFPFRLLGHRDLGQTECPGDGAYARLPAIRRAVAARMASGEPRTATAAATASATATTRASATPRPATTRAATATPVPTPRRLPPDCEQLVAGGDFEADEPRWLLQNGFYTQYEAFRGRRSLFLGLRPSDPDVGTTYSTALQAVRLPELIASAELSLAVRVVGDGQDRRSVRLLDETGAAIGHLELGAPGGAWQVASLDVTRDVAPFAGRDVLLYLANVNDGDGERSFLRIDDVSLIACRSSTVSTAWSPPTADATPPGGESSPLPSSATATGGAATATVVPGDAATATAVPGDVRVTATPQLAPAPPSATPTLVCLDVVQDGGFEAPEAAHWLASGDAPPLRVAGAAHRGAGAMSFDLAPPVTFQLVYAAVEEALALPLGIVTATLSLWWRAGAGTAADALIVEVRDRQRGVRHLVARPTLGATADWQRLEVDLPPGLLGPQRELYLAVLHRPLGASLGGATQLLVDDVALRVCHRPIQRRYLPGAQR